MLEKRKRLFPPRWVGVPLRMDGIARRLFDLNPTQYVQTFDVYEFDRTDLVENAIGFVNTRQEGTTFLLIAVRPKQEDEEADDAH